MNNIYAKRIYEVTFNKPEFNANYSIIRQESGAFQYGNSTMVVVLRNGEEREILDTRYDKLVMRDFNQWCEEYLKQAFNKDYEPKWKLVESFTN